MKYFVIIMMMFFSVQLKAQEDYESYFSENSLRVDLVLAGNNQSEQVYLHRLKKEPSWAGSKINLIDPFNYGEYKIEVFDLETEKLIYSKGFCTLFEEWQTTNEAKEISKSFFQL